MVDIVTRAGKGSPLTNNEVDANFTNLAEVSGVTGEPMGHEDRTTSTISFNASTRTFTIAPVNGSFTVWCKGKKVVVSSAQTVTIPNTSGMHSIYYDANGTLLSKIGYFSFSTEAPTAYVYWNATTGAAPYFGDERHGVVLDWQTHEYLHRTRGAAIANGFLASGYTLNNSATNAATQIAIESGTFFDEDMKIDIVSTATPTAGTYQQNLLFPAKIPVLHLQGTSWVMDAPTDFPFKQGTSRPQYNSLSGGVWSTTDVGNNQHATTWILATNNLTYPVIAIIGQSATDNLGEAEAFAFADLSLTGFPSVEFRPLYKLIYKASDGYANSVNAQLVSIVDLRSISAVGSVANPATDHGNLSGLSDDDHPQYLSVDTVRTSLTAAVKASFLPSQTGNSGKFLTTDATSASWTALTSSNITTALGFTPYNATNPAGYISGITSSNVTTALGFTPYNATNPSGYVTAAGARGAISVTGAGSYDSATGVINIVGGVTSFNTRTGAISLTSADVTAALGFTPYNNTNPNNYLTGITSMQVTTALGYTPYNSSNPSGYITGITSGMVTTALGYTPYNSSNPSGYITSSALSGYLTSSTAASTYLPLGGGTVTGATSISTGGSYPLQLISTQRYGLQVRNINNSVNSGYGWWLAHDSNSNFALHADGIGDILTVGRNGSFTVNGNTVLHAGNYNSYALPLSGGNLSGDLQLLGNYLRFDQSGTRSWNMRAANGDLNLTSGDTSGSFYVTLTGGVRSPIFYDSGNTGYYIDPNGTSNVVSIYTEDSLVRIQKVHSEGGEIRFLSADSSTGGWIQGHSGGLRTVDHSWTQTTWNIDNAGNSVATASHRAPIFYDSNDTGRYLDPNGTSILGGLFIAATASTGRSAYGSGTANLVLYAESTYGRATIDFRSGVNYPSDGAQIYYETATNLSSGETSRLVIRTENDADDGILIRGGYVTINSTTTDGGSQSPGFQTQYNGTARLYTYSDNTTEAGSFRAPLFYDSANTAYYLDPNSYSYLGAVVTDNWLRASGQTGLYSQSYGQHFYAKNDGDMWAATGDGSAQGGIIFYQGYESSRRGYVYWDNDGFGLLHSGGGWAIRATTSYSEIPNSLRTPVLYDTNDTSYYVDANSTSVLNRINMWGRLGVDDPLDYNSTVVTGLTSAPLDTQINYDPNVGTTNRFLPLTHQTALHSGGYRTHLTTGLFKNASGWGENSTGWFAALGGSDGNPTMEWRLTFGTDIHNSYGYVSQAGSFRAPVFYDSNDTAYYVDPNSSGTCFKGYGTVDSRVGFTSIGNPWGTANSAYFPNGITTAGTDNWIYGHTYVGNAPGNGAGHEFWSNGEMRSTSTHRATLYYDDQNTGYYCDPNSTSSFYRLNINNNVYFTNYGRGMVGEYASTRYQAVFAMGDSYKLPDDGTTTGSLYGICWSHPNAGGTAGNLNTHGALFLENGSFLAAVSGSIRSRDDMRSPIFYDSVNTGYYIDPNSSSNIGTVTVDNWFRASGNTGLYFPSYDRGLRAADAEFSYGNVGVYGGGKNGWYGYGVYANNCILMSNGSTWGIHNPQWGWPMVSDSSGNTTFGGNVTAYSDLRLKDNVREIDNVVERRNTLAMSAIKYEREGRTRIGYGAQTLRDNGCAEFVLEADDALKLATGLGTLSVDYGETAAVLAVTSKMTDDRVAILEAKIARLEAIIESLIGD